MRDMPPTLHSLQEQTKSIKIAIFFYFHLQVRQSLTGCFVAAYQAKSGNAQWNVLTFWIKSRLDCRFCRNAAVYESARLLLQKICNAQKGRMEDAIEKPAKMPLTPAMPQFLKLSIFVRALKSAVFINSSGKTFSFWRRKEQTRSGDKLKPLDLVVHRLQPGNKKKSWELFHRPLYGPPHWPGGKIQSVVRRKWNEQRPRRKRGHGTWCCRPSCSWSSSQSEASSPLPSLPSSWARRWSGGDQWPWPVVAAAPTEAGPDWSVGHQKKFTTKNCLFQSRRSDPKRKSYKKLTQFTTG